MNKYAFRLIFSRRLCMWLAVSEVSHGQGKQSKTGSTSTVVGLLVASAVGAASHSAIAQSRPPVTFASKLPAPTFNLPQPYTKVFTAPGAPRAGQFVNDPASAGKVSWTVDGKTATFNQGSVSQVILNWDSFDIGAGYTVRFAQDPDPTKYVSALNRVWSDRPSIIQGALEANREVMLVNNQGVYFGSTARVNAGRFVASANSVSNAVFEKGIRNVVDGSVVFSTAGADHLPTHLNSAISVEPGAQISSAAGGDVLLVAPRVVNQGRIETPAGQSILAAGDKIYLMSSSDPAQRGLIVAVDPIKTADGRNDAELGVVENAADGKTVASAGLVQKINEIRANSGSVNLVGLTVRQNGVINATTAVKGANGAIYLQAMASTVLLDATTDPVTNPNSETLRRGWLVEASSQVRAGAELGAVQLGANSITAVRPDASTATQLDAEVFNPSRIRVEGRAITLASGSQVVAPAGRIELLAAKTAVDSPLFDSQVPGFTPADDSRAVLAPGAIVSAAGLRDVAVDGARNQGELRLFRIELADAPVQRDTPLYRSQVYFDLRDGSKISTANVSGAAAALARTAEERSTRGGSIAVAAEGGLVVAESAQLDVSGGSVNYSATTMKNSLLEQDGRVVTFRASAAGSPVSNVLADSQSTPVPAYQEGADGGILSVSARSAELRGGLVGTVVTGQLQRDGRSKAAKPAVLQIGRNAAADYDFAKLTLRNAPRAPLAPLDPRLFSDNALADLPALPLGLDLYLDSVSAGGFGKLLLRGSEVTQPEFGTLNLGPGGELEVLARTRLDLNGAFIAPGGRISVRSTAGVAGTGDVQLSSTTRLDAAGRWYNDTAGAENGDASPASRSINGGQVNVTAPNNLTLQPGAIIDVSAGAALNAAGTLTKGSAGSITLSGGRATTVGQFGGLSLTGAELRGFGFASGGKLNLNAQNLRIANDNAPGFTLAPAFFSAGGFDSINVSAFGDVRLASGITLTPQLRTWQFGDGWRQEPSAAMSDAVAIADLTDTQLGERKPVSLTLSATRPLLTGGANVVVERGARMLLDPGASLVLNATGSIDVGQSGGSAGQRSVLSAPGGAISLNVLGSRGGNEEADPVGFLGSQAIWLGSDATLSTSGTAQTRRDGAAAPVSLFNTFGAPATPQDQRVTGTVLGGGPVTLNAQRGYVVAQPGAMVSLDGATAELNFAGLAQPVKVAKPAGDLNVFSPEGIFWNGSVSAQAPRTTAGRALADGGALNLSLAGDGVLQRVGTNLASYSTAPRTLVIGSEAELLRLRTATLGTDLSTTLGNGNGFVDSALLQTSGFDSLRLAAGDAIRFDKSVSLTSAIGVQLNAPTIVAQAGTQVVLNTTQAQIGYAPAFPLVQPADTSAKPDSSALRNTSLAVNANTIDVYGNVGLQGFSVVNLNAGANPFGEIRFSAAAPDFGIASSRVKQLNFAGELSLAASQIYSTTATQYSLYGLPAQSESDVGSKLLIKANTATEATKPPPLSAFASLTVNATDIEQGGTLRQPFGRITLNAERVLSFGEGSVTSVSSAGASALYGQTLNLAQWQPPGPVTTASALPISKGLSLTAGQIVTAPTAQVGAAAGGTVRAWEFFPGVGGSQDYFDTDGLFAVLPDYANTPSLALNGGIVASSQLGKQLVVTMPGSGLAPGRYTLMPARLALLASDLPQGAFLVRRATDQGKTVLRAPALQDDGSVVVTGFISSSGSRHDGVPGERFVVEPAATFQAKSDIRVSDIGRLLAEQAATSNLARPALPGDGGRVQVQVNTAAADTTPSLWQARLDLAAPATAPVNGPTLQAGQLDVSATRLALVDQLSKAPAGALGVSADAIAGSGAASVLLGGQRSAATGPTAAAGDVLIDARGTQSVLVDLGNQQLRSNEILLAAQNSVTLAAGTQINSTAAPVNSDATTTRQVQLSGDGALLAVSAEPLQVQRRGASLAQGQLSIGAGSVLQGQQVTLDATGALNISSSTRIQAGALDIGARRIVVGDSATGDATTAATTLGGDLLATVRDTPDLTLRAYSSIDFVGQQNWSQRGKDANAAPDVVKTRLVLDAPVLRGLTAASGTPANTDIAAQEVVVRNTSGLVPNGTLAGLGSFTLQALPPLRWGQTGGMSLGPGAVSLGFDSVALRSSGDVVLRGLGSTLAQRDLNLSAARITASTGAEQTLVAAGDLRIGREANSRTLNERVGQGASVNIKATRIDQLGVLDLPGASLKLQAAGTGDDRASISFGAGSMTSVAGFTLTGDDGFAAYSSAGSLIALAATGSIDVLGSLDVSAARRTSGDRGEGDAGSIALHAAGAGGQLVLANGAFQGRAGSAPGDFGGRLTIDVTRLSSVDAVAQAATGGGLTRELYVRVREGDVALNQSISAQRISIAADGGNLQVINATLQAAAPTGGVVQLMAGNDLVLGDNTRIDARSSRVGANGGDVLLASGEAGRTRIATDAVVDAGGTDAQDGRIVLRAMRGADGRSVRIDPLNTAQLRAGAVDIEAVRIYRDVSNVVRGDGTGSTLGQATVAADNTSFINQATAPVMAALGVGSAEASRRVQLLPGVELRSNGDLNVVDDWKLNSNDSIAVAGNAGYLSLRAVGDINFAGSMSAGFGSTAKAAAHNDNTRSWSYRVAAGADLTAGNPLAINDFSRDDDTRTGSVNVAAGKQLRTGAGAIGLAAARDLVFSAPDVEGSAAGSVFIAGRKRTGVSALATELFSRAQAKPLLTEQGGRLDVFAARDVVAPEATQWVGNWFWRSAALDLTQQNYTGVGQLAWWPQLSRFEQTLGSFGGGHLTVQAGRDVINVQAMAPSSGFADDTSVSKAKLQVFNGGDVSVTAGRDVRGGQFFAGLGQGRLQAGGEVGNASENLRLTAPSLALMDGNWRVAARTGVSLGGVFNPTATAASASDNRFGVSGYFYTWGAQAGLQVSSNAGAVNLGTQGDADALDAFGLDSNDTVQTYTVQPASLRITAAGGPIQLTGTAPVMFPSATGQLALWSAANIRSSGQLAMADSPPQSWPTFTRPANAGGNTIITDLLPNTLADNQPLTGLHANDTEPVRIHAEGSLFFEGTGSTTTLLLPKPTRIYAGEDIIQLSLRGQNLRADDYTAIAAGRNYLAGRQGGVEVVGPGSLEVTAGRQLDLGASVGIFTTGNVRNANLLPQGAAVSLTAASTGTLDIGRFSANYLQPSNGSGSPHSATYRAALVAFVQQGLNLPATSSLSFEQAWAQFQTFPANARARFGRQVLDAELGATYLSGSVPSEAQMLERLRSAFERQKAQVLKAGDDALQANQALTLPGRETLKGDALASYLSQIRALEFNSLDLDSTVVARVASLQKLQAGWRAAVARSTDGATLDRFSGRTFEAFRAQLLGQEIANAGLAASNFGRLSLPMRLALFEEGFRAAELTGAGSFMAQPIWPADAGVAPAFSYSGTLNMTQSSVVTERGGDISLVNAGGAINVGLKQTAAGTIAPKGVITLGGGNIFGYARDDFQVNTQRVFVVGKGDMAIWSSGGDIDSGRGANTAVAAPPLAARRSVDGVVFETPATTTGSGLGILEDASGRRSGSIGLYPAFGEILALDAFIRAPSVVLGSSIQGADNLVSARVGGAAAPVAAPPVVAAAPASTNETKATSNVSNSQTQETRPRNSLLTVELLGLGAAADDLNCDDAQRRDDKCPPAPASSTTSCSAEQKANGTCKPSSVPAR